MNYLKRLQSAPSPFIVSKRENINYLTGSNQLHPVNREALLFINSPKFLLYHSPFLIPPSYPWLESIPMTPAHPLKSVLSTFFSTIQPFSHSAIAFETHNLTVAEHTQIRQALPHMNLEPTNSAIETLRQTKDPDEIKAIRRACTITRRTMSWAHQALKRLSALALNEITFSRLIEQKLYDYGADGLAFPPIVAFGPHSALPHHQPGNTMLKPPSVVLLDFGAVYQGYCADMTRTIFVGTPPPRFLEVESIVKTAYAAGLNLLKQHFSVSELTALPEFKLNTKYKILNTPPLIASQIDAVVRNSISQSGYGKEFIHTTGHALGLEIHEQPSLNSANPTPLSPGMTITLEPGVYLPGHFGCRHENTLLLS